MLLPLQSRYNVRVLSRFHSSRIAHPLTVGAVRKRIELEWNLDIILAEEVFDSDTWLFCGCAACLFVHSLPTVNVPYSGCRLILFYYLYFALLFSKRSQLSFGAVSSDVKFHFSVNFALRHWPNIYQLAAPPLSEIECYKVWDTVVLSGALDSRQLRLTFLTELAVMELL